MASRGEWKTQALGSTFFISLFPQKVTGQDGGSKDRRSAAEVPAPSQTTPLTDENGGGLMSDELESLGS